MKVNIGVIGAKDCITAMINGPTNGFALSSEMIARHLSPKTQRKLHSLTCSDFLQHVRKTDRVHRTLCSATVCDRLAADSAAGRNAGSIQKTTATFGEDTCCGWRLQITNA